MNVLRHRRRRSRLNTSHWNQVVQQSTRIALSQTVENQAHIVNERDESDRSHMQPSNLNSSAEFMIFQNEDDSESQEHALSPETTAEINVQPPRSIVNLNNVNDDMGYRVENEIKCDNMYDTDCSDGERPNAGIEVPIDFVDNECLSNEQFLMFQNDEDEPETSLQDFNEPDDNGNHLIPTSVTTQDRRIYNTIANILQRNLRKKATKEILLAMISIFGKIRYTGLGYEHYMRSICAYNSTVSFPSYSSMRKTVFPYFVNHLFVKSELVSFESHLSVPRILNSNTSKINATNLRSRDRRREIRIVKPSSWARLDLITQSIFNDLFCIDRCFCNMSETSSMHERRITSAPAVKNPSQLTKRCSSFFVSNNGIPRAAVQRDIIDIQFIYPDLISSCPLSKLFDISTKDDAQSSYICTSEVSCSYFINGVDGDSGVWNIGKLEDLNHTEKLSFAYMKNRVSISLCDPTTNLPTWTTQKQQTQKRRRYRNSRNSFHLRKHGRSMQHSNSFQYIADESSYEGMPVVLPGDSIVFLRSTLRSNHNSACIYLNTYWRWNGSGRCNALLIFKQSEYQSQNLFHPCETIELDQIPSFSKNSVINSQNSYITTENQCTERHSCSTKGILEDGTPYYNYQMLLYSDDFVPRSPLFPHGSVGGFYMLPMGLSRSAFLKSTSVRTISLTPHGLSSKLVFEYIITDILECMTRGIQCVDINGLKCKLFIEVLGYVADYPESAEVIDVMKHSAGAPCTHCNFRRRGDNIGSSYAYTKHYHSGNSSYTRGLIRTMALRATGIPDDHCKWNGMNPGSTSDISKPGMWPLIKLSHQINGISDKIPKNVDGEDVVSPYFDGYMNNIIAPDHLITGLAKCLIECSFVCLVTERKKRRLSSRICSELKEIGEYGDKSIYNFNSNKLHSINMSAIYGILTILPYVIMACGFEYEIHCFKLITILNQFSTMVFRWPNLYVDGVEDVNFYHGSKVDAYNRKIISLAQSYIYEVDKFCREYDELKRYVDRPNVHRLLELVIHSLSLFSHASFFAELGFEHAHQPLKFSLARNSNQNSHIYAVNLVLARDWFVRILDSWNCYVRSDDTKRKGITNCLLTLLCGNTFCEVDWSLPELEEIKSEMISFSTESIDGLVANRLDDLYGDKIIRTDNYLKGWVAVNATQTLTISSDDQNRKYSHSVLFCEDFNQWVVEHVSAYTVQNVNKVKLFSKLVYKEVNFKDSNLYRTNRNVYEHHNLKVGDVIQVLVNNSHSTDKLIISSTNGIGTKLFYVLLAIAAVSIDEPWVVMTKMSHLSNNIYQSLLPSYNNISIMKMTSNIRKGSAIHACHKNRSCTYHIRSNSFQHSEMTIYGGKFFVLGRETGYPPRRA